MEKITKKDKMYTDGMFFELRLTSRYLTIMGNKAFEKMRLKMNFEEYIILDIISCNNGICHIDLAKMLLRDRSNLGKIVSNLEKYGYVNIAPAIRNKRVIKKIFVTEEGIKICNEIYQKMKVCIQMFNENIDEKDQNIIINCMQKCRKIIDKIFDTQI